MKQPFAKEHCPFGLNSSKIDCAKVTLLREVTLTAVQLSSILNFTQLTCTEKFKIEPKCAAVKVTSLSEVALTQSILPNFG